MACDFFLRKKTKNSQIQKYKKVHRLRDPFITKVVNIFSLIIAIFSIYHPICEETFGILCLT